MRISLKGLEYVTVATAARMAQRPCGVYVAPSTFDCATNNFVPSRGLE